MRFLVQPTPGLVARARPPVRIFVLFAALALAGSAAQRVHAGGLSPAAIEAYYLGAAEEDALPAAALFEELHVGAFVYGFVLFVLASVLAVCPVRPAVRGTLVGVAFAATLADLGAPFLVRGAGGLGGVRVATFLLAVGALAALCAVVAATFGGGSRRSDA
jgi:hypothetical protein